MEIITYQIENEVDAARITSMFDEKEIPYTIKKNSDLFPYNGERRAFAELLILREFEKQAQAIFDEVMKSRNTAHEEPSTFEGEIEIHKTSKKRNLWRPVLILYSITVTVLLIRYWNIDRKNSQSKNFKSTWNLSNTELIVRRKSDQQLIDIYSDANYDLNFEKTETYTKRNTLASRASDFNEDGFVDEVTYFGMNGKVSGSAADYDSDGEVDETIVILETGDTLKLTDKNHDGFFILEK